MSKRWRSGALHPVPETLTIPSVAKRWRSGTLHLENLVSKRWRSDTLHPETLVPTTTPPQLRWCAGVLGALRSFRRPREKQSDLSQRVKRSRLAPAQVMTTIAAKHCDWSLDFDERGPVFDGAQDWRRSVFLTGRAAKKEVYFASESPENQRLLLAAMEREWKKWEEHKATLPLTQGELRMLKSRFPYLKIVGTRWVLTPKEPDFKARLVVQGCQEDPCMVRTDPLQVVVTFFLVLSCEAQEHWSCGSADAASAYLQARRIELLLLMMPKRQPPPGCEPGEMRVARGNIYGTLDEGRSWYQHLCDKFAGKFRVHESALEKRLYLYDFNGRFTFVTVTHIDNLFHAYDTRCKTTKSLLDAIVKEFNMSRKMDDFVYCGRRVRVTPEALIVSHELAASSLVPMEFVWNPTAARNHVDIQRTQRISQFVGKTPMVATSITPRSVIRSESCSTTSQRSHSCRCSSIQCNFSQSSAILGNHSEISTRSDHVSSAQLVTYGDASFANMEGSKSQCGVIVFLTHESRCFWHGEFQLGHLFFWTSSTIQRVVRSTLAAEAYSVSEAVDEAQWLRSVLAEMWLSVPSSLPRSLRIVEMDSLRRNCNTLRFLQSLSSCQVRQGYWIGQATPNRDVETSLLWSTGSDICMCHDSRDARRCFDEGSGPLSFVACGNKRTSPRVHDFRIQHKCEDNIADVLRAYANSQNGD